MSDEIGVFSFADAQKIYDATVLGNKEIKEHRRPGGGGKGGMQLFGARMTEDWTSGVAECEIYTLDGMTLTYLENANVYDPLYIWAALGNGDYLLVVKQAGKYYTNPAGCPGTSPLIADPPDTLP